MFGSFLGFFEGRVGIRIIFCFFFLRDFGIFGIVICYSLVLYVLFGDICFNGMYLFNSFRFPFFYWGGEIVVSALFFVFLVLNKCSFG